MIKYWDENITELIRKYITKIKNDSELRKNSGIKKVNVHEISTSAANHTADDFYKLFGITKIQGHIIRSFFQEMNPNYYIPLLHEEFPDLLESEDLNYINDMEKNCKNEKHNIFR